MSSAATLTGYSSGGGLSVSCRRMAQVSAGSPRWGTTTAGIHSCRTARPNGSTRDAVIQVHVDKEPSNFNHDWGTEAVALKYLHVRIESESWPSGYRQATVASAHRVVIGAGFQVAEEQLKSDFRRKCGC